MQRCLSEAVGQVGVGAAGEELLGARQLLRARVVGRLDTYDGIVQRRAAGEVDAVHVVALLLEEPLDRFDLAELRAVTEAVHRRERAALLRSEHLLQALLDLLDVVVVVVCGRNYGVPPVVVGCHWRRP
eukprot:2030811-Prymnesium_polylepis.1